MSIRVTIDGQSCIGQEGQTILEIAQQYQIDIPTLCHDPRLKPYASCGLCVVEIQGSNRLMRACATTISEGQVILTNSPRVQSSRQTTLELLLSDHRGDCRPPCMLACPAQTDCQGYVGLIANGQFDEALALIKEKLPLPASIGLVCPHPCEDACRRRLVEEPIAIADLKTLVGELDLQKSEPYLPPAAPASGKKVAVVGAGPAGLTAAYFLALDGHQVTVYDSMAAPGGMLRYGIPEYRLPKAILDQEINLIARLGVDFVMDTRLGQDIQLDELRGQYDALFIGVGAWKSSKIRCPGEELPGVIGGIDFLRQVAITGGADIGKRVAIIGGGNTAMDAARTARRLGADQVTVLYRRTRQEMPADAREIDEAIEEGVQFKYLCAPLEITGEERVSSIKLQLMQLGEPDASGRCRPEPIPGAEEILELDTIIAAIGQEVVCPDMPGVEKDKWGCIVADADTLMTSLEGVFAGGDAVTGPGIAIEAIAQGRKAALAISDYLLGKPIKHTSPFLVKRDDITREILAKVPPLPRQGHTLINAEERRQHFGRVTVTMAPEAAIKEASRCLECGCMDYFECKLIKYAQEYQVHPEWLQGSHREEILREQSHFIRRDSQKCILCGLCVRICAEVMGVEALGLVGRGFDTMVKPMFGLPLEDAGCISCGQCAAVCPTGALVEQQAWDKNVPLTLTTTITTCSGCSLGCQQAMENRGSQLVRALPAADGLLCQEGRAGWYGYNRERITEPLIKTNGGFSPASWEEAFDLIAARLKEVKANDIALWAGAELTQEEAAAMMELGKNYLGTKRFYADMNGISPEIERVLAGYDLWAQIKDISESADIFMIGSFNHSAVVPAQVRRQKTDQQKIYLVAKETALAEDMADYILDFEDATILFKSAVKYLAGAILPDCLQNELEEIEVNEGGKKLAELIAAAEHPFILVDGCEMAEETILWVANLARLLRERNASPIKLSLITPGANAWGLHSAGFNKWNGNPYRAGLVLGSDPLNKAARPAEAEFLAVAAAHWNDTARAADLVLPLSLPWETSGTYLDFTGQSRQLKQTAVPPGQLTNSEIVYKIISRL